MDADDRRERRVRLTPAGRERILAAKTEWKGAQDALRSAMTDAQWKAMFETFAAVTQAAQHLGELTAPGAAFAPAAGRPASSRAEPRTPRRRSQV